MKNTILFIVFLLASNYAMSQSSKLVSMEIKWNDTAKVFSDSLNIDEILITKFPKEDFDSIILLSTLRYTYTEEKDKENKLSKPITLKDLFDSLKIVEKHLKKMKDGMEIKIPIKTYLNKLKDSGKNINNVSMNLKSKNNEPGKAIKMSNEEQANGKDDVVKDNTERDLVLEKLKSIGISLGNPSFVFITKEMFNNLQTFGYGNLQHCMNNKYDKQLPGEYIWLYDMKNGDYYTLKKKVRKPIISANPNKQGCPDSPECKNCCIGIEYYKWKKSMWYTPPVGSQFKVELMNYSADDSINLSFTYKDNFLEDEANFKSILEKTGNINASDTSKKDIGKTNKTELQNAKDKDSVANSNAENLIKLRNDLFYYNANFNFNSATMQRHLKNLQYINDKVKEVFRMSISELISKYKTDQKEDDDLNKLIKEIDKLYNRIYNMQTYSFLAQKLKNYDYLTMTFKDKKGNDIKTEEMRLFGGFKIDFSTGIFLTGLKDANYVFIDSTVKYRRPDDTTNSIQTLVDTTGKIVIRENSGKSKIGFGVLVHAYPRISSNYNISLTAGLAVNTETELNFMLGGSLLLGSNRRFVISGGLIWGKVKKLSNTVKTGVNRRDSSNSNSTPIFYTTTDNLVPTITDTRRSWFFGVSYNFTAR